MRVYDMAVIGGGPGGCTAALYAARAGLQVVILEQLSAGGQMALTEHIENYPGFDAGVDGFTLGEQMRRGALRSGNTSCGGAACHAAGADQTVGHQRGHDPVKNSCTGDGSDAENARTSGRKRADRARRPLLRCL